ncbi:MAG: hypothetical protein RMI80_11320, partial [Meiothermus sp.]|uniref:hypothetical protein n=1 Tax=Meiothermus sp. TaxID=1955249 RepID=UPI00298F2B5C
MEFPRGQALIRYFEPVIEESNQSMMDLTAEENHGYGNPCAPWTPWAWPASPHMEYGPLKDDAHGALRL